MAKVLRVPEYCELLLEAVEYHCAKEIPEAGLMLWGRTRIEHEMHDFGRSLVVALRHDVYGTKPVEQQVWWYNQGAQ